MIFLGSKSYSLNNLIICTVREARLTVQAVLAVTQELEAENYDIDRINARKGNVLRLWQYLYD